MTRQSRHIPPALTILGIRTRFRAGVPTPGRARWKSPSVPAAEPLHEHAQGTSFAATTLAARSLN